MGGGSIESSYGAGGGHFGAKGEGAIGAVGGDPIVLGSVDRSLVDEVVKRHLNAIRHCYQRALRRDPDLAGKVVVEFVIAADGTVSSAEIEPTTLGHRRTEECVRKRILRMTFPAPAGGGTVVVRYPFLFSPG